MRTTVIDMPTDLRFSAALAFASRLRDTDVGDRVLLNCGGRQRWSPFTMLFVSAAIRQWRARTRSIKPEVSFQARGAATTGYAAHMGMWQACGIPLGKAPGAAKGSDRYLPITPIDRISLTAAPQSKGLRLPQALDVEADRLAEVLCQGAGDAFETTLQYALRELLRNVFEHSRADAAWYCAQYWPSNDRVEIAVLDEGVGIQRSLATNPQFADLKTEEDALRKAVQRGVTRAVPPSQVPFDSIGSNDPDRPLSEREWGNSGLGLFVLHQLARVAGDLVIVSNNTAVKFTAEGSDVFLTDFCGTAVRMALRPSLVGEHLMELIEDLQETAGPLGVTPSMLARLRARDARTPAAR